MQDYDVALKVLLQGSARLTMLAVTGGAIEKWLNIELPKVQNLRADLLGETTDGELVHVELQSSNDSIMPLRMAEYCLGVFRHFKKFPRQVVLYVGEAPLGMDSELRGPDLSFRYRTIDIRDLDGDQLLESEETGDNVIAILARLRDAERAVRKIVGRIAKLPAAERELAFQQLIILAGLRRLSKTVEKETRTMPIYIDLLENEVIGPAYKKGLEEGELKGKLEGELRIIRQLMEKRFGPIPAWAEERLAARSAAGLEELSGRILDVTSLEDFLR
jgi:predicted transposase YdaD